MDSQNSEKRVSVISIIVEDQESSQKVNDTLHSYGSYIIGRLGIPYQAKDISVICVVMDAPPPLVSALSGKLGMINGVAAKTVTSKY